MKKGSNLKKLHRLSFMITLNNYIDKTGLINTILISTDVTS